MKRIQSILVIVLLCLGIYIAVQVSQLVHHTDQLVLQAQQDETAIRDQVQVHAPTVFAMIETANQGAQEFRGFEREQRIYAKATTKAAALAAKATVRFIENTDLNVNGPHGAIPELTRQIHETGDQVRPLLAESTRATSNAADLIADPHLKATLASLDVSMKTGTKILDDTHTLTSRVVEVTAPKKHAVPLSWIIDLIQALKVAGQVRQGLGK